MRAVASKYERARLDYVQDDQLVTVQFCNEHLQKSPNARTSSQTSAVMYTAEYQSPTTGLGQPILRDYSKARHIQILHAVYLAPPTPS
jgi:hypothetical protein